MSSTSSDAGELSSLNESLALPSSIDNEEYNNSSTHHIIYPAHSQYYRPHQPIPYADLAAVRRAVLKHSLDFIIDTDYNRSATFCNLTTPFPSVSSPFMAYLDHTPNLKGYISPRFMNAFIWEEGTFKPGMEVTLGNTLRLVRVGGVKGVGKNYYEVEVGELELDLLDERAIESLIVSTSLDESFKISLLQRISQHFFGRFLPTFQRYVDTSMVKREQECQVKARLVIETLEQQFGVMSDCNSTFMELGDSDRFRDSEDTD